jgi:Zn-dependent protease with chaperone function
MHRHTDPHDRGTGRAEHRLGLALGDVSALVSTGASLLTGLAYRRGHEAEADCFAAGLMQHAGLPSAPMADLLLGIDAGAGGEKATRREGPSWMNLLSSHPDTALRARELKEGTRRRAARKV